MSWSLVSEFWADNSVYDEGKVYSLASTLDPFFLDLIGIKN